MFHVEQFGNQPNSDNVPRGTIWEPAQPGKCSTWNNLGTSPTRKMFHVEQFGTKPKPGMFHVEHFLEPVRSWKCSTWNTFESQPEAGNVPRGTLPAKPKQA